MYIEVNDNLIEYINHWALQHGLSIKEGVETALNNFVIKEILKPNSISCETMLLSEPALAEDWLKPEEDEAWNYLQSVKL